jgi:4-amino-4-deoxy-L-arabinose transferase-like glycosyltransferase
MTRHQSRITYYVSRFTLLTILLLAAFLRFYRLDVQSFWNDEGNSARLSERTVDLIIEGTASDIHPPGYYLLLHYWRALFGHSEFALRALSAVAGLALVLFTYLLGHHLFGVTAGLAAAFLGSISPFAIYYSQEARMYSLLAALAAASTYLLLRIPNLQSPVSNDRVNESANQRTVGFAIAYVLTAAAGLYTQYAFPFVLLVHNLIFAMWWLAVARGTARRWRRLGMWVGVQAAIGALYSPWLPIAIRSVTSWPSAGQAYELGPALLNVLRWLGVGHTLPLEEAWGPLVGMGALLLLGLWPRRERDRFGVAGLALYLLLPIALIFAFDLYKEAWLKFLIVVLPAFHVLMAHGAANLAWAVGRDWRLEIKRFRTPSLQSLVSILLIGLVAFATFPSLRNLYLNPAYFRDDYRQIASDIASTAPSGSAVILNAPNQWEVFTYYYPDRDVYPVPYRLSSGEVDAFLSALSEEHQRFYVVYWGDAESDPRRHVESWLAANTYKAGDRWYGRVRLATYGVAQLLDKPAVAVDAHFGESAHLQGYALGVAVPKPGDVLPVTLFWEALASAPEPHKISVQLLDGAGQLVAQHDAEPVSGFVPTTAWQPGQVIIDRHGIQLPDDLPADRYTLAVAVYYAYSGARLPVMINGEKAGDHLPLGDVHTHASR